MSTCPPLRLKRNGNGSAAGLVPVERQDDSKNTLQEAYCGIQDKCAIMPMTKT